MVLIDFNTSWICVKGLVDFIFKCITACNIESLVCCVYNINICVLCCNI